MASTPEAKNTTFVNKHIVRNFDAHVRCWKIFDSITIGKPDSEYIRKDGNRGSVLKIEYKYIKELPKRDTTLVKPSWQNALQRMKLTEYFTCDGNALAVIFVGERDADCIVFLNNDEWENGLTTAQCRDRLINRSELADYIVWRVTNEQHGKRPAKLAAAGTNQRAVDSGNSTPEQRHDCAKGTLL